jgi:hypothetical protein
MDRPKRKAGVRRWNSGLDEAVVACTAGLRGRRGLPLLGLGWAGLDWYAMLLGALHPECGISRRRRLRASAKV